MAKRSTKTKSYLPNEIITQILLSLPPKSLVRFRCACKYWLALTTNPHFIEAHLKRSSTLINNNRLLLISTHFRSSMKREYSICSCAEIPRIELMNLVPPFDSSIPQLIEHPYVVGSCNGVLCLSIHYASNPNPSICLWNPSIMEYWILPNNINYGAELLGFGCKRISVDIDDYQVVRIVNNSDVTNHVEVYSLRSNSWKSIGDDVCPPELQILYLQNQAFCGAVHWSALYTKDKKKPQAIAAFDLADEKFNIFSLPHREFYNECYVGVLDGCLSFFGNQYMNLDVLVMKEYGRVESWTKLYAIKLGRDLCRSSLRTLGRFWSGELILKKSSDGYLIFYDPKTERFEDLGVCHAVGYVESLVSVMPPTVI